MNLNEIKNVESIFTGKIEAICNEFSGLSNTTKPFYKFYESIYTGLTMKQFNKMQSLKTCLWFMSGEEVLKISKGKKFLSNWLELREQAKQWYLEQGKFFDRNDMIRKTEIYSLNDLKNHYSRLTQGHWFKPDTMRFFNSRLSEDLFYDHKEACIYFVSSEKFNFEAPRLYTIRKYCIYTGSIDDVNGFQNYNSGQTAKNVIKRLLK